jgi:hypothetical protein
LFSQQENRSKLPPPIPPLFSSSKSSGFVEPPIPPSVFLKLNLKFSKRENPQAFREGTFKRGETLIIIIIMYLSNIKSLHN